MDPSWYSQIDHIGDAGIALTYHALVAEEWAAGRHAQIIFDT